MRAARPQNGVALGDLRCLSESDVSTGCRSMTDCAILIPVYQPRATVLRELIDGIRSELRRIGSDAPIWVVNDGSDAEHDALFRELESAYAVRVVRHAINLG